MINRALTFTRMAFLLLCLSLPWSGANAGAVTAEEAKTFVQDFGNRAIQSLTEPDLPRDVLEKRFSDFYHEGFDGNAIAISVLARYWRTATEQERKEFLQLFETFIIQTYSQKFTLYSGEQFETRGTLPREDGDITVLSEVVRPSEAGAQPLRIDWTVTKTDKGFKINDVVMEGVSMIITQRSEFASVIRQGGGKIQALLDALRKKTTELASNGGNAPAATPQ